MRMGAVRPPINLLIPTFLSINMNDTIRRLAKIKRRPTMADKSDDWLLLCVEDATAYFLEYTNRAIDPGEKADHVICEMAVYRINTEGFEDMMKAKDGELEREVGTEWPPMLKSRLNSWRLMRGLHATDSV